RVSSTYRDYMSRSPTVPHPCPSPRGSGEDYAPSPLPPPGGWGGVQPCFPAGAIPFAGSACVRLPSAVFSAVARIIAITSGGVSLGLTAKILPARFATCGEDIDVPDSARRSPPGIVLSTWKPFAWTTTVGP